MNTLFFKNKQALSWRGYVFLVFVALACFLPGINSLPPTDRDESLYAQASKQMVESRNYTDIHFQNEVRYKKPIGIYWLQSAAVKIFNPAHLNEIWVYRVPSIIGAVTAVLFTALLGCLLFGSEAGFLAALMMAGCLMLGGESKLAKTDAMLLASIAIMQYALARVYLLRQSNWLNFCLFWGGLGAGILIKGPIILMVLAGTFLGLWIANRNLGWFKILRPRVGIPLLLLIILPWFLAITIISNGAFFTKSAGQDFLGKLWQSQNRGFLPPGAYIIAFFFTFFPFAICTALALPHIWKNRAKPAFAFCLSWIVPFWIVFEISFTKLPHYTMPLYPAIAALTAKTILDGFTMPPRWSLWFIFSITLSCIVTMALASVGVFLPWAMNQHIDWVQICASLILILSQGAGLYLLFTQRKKAIFVMLIGSVIFASLVYTHTLPSLNHLWLSRDIVRVMESHRPANCPLITYAYNEPSLIFLAGTDTTVTRDVHSTAKAMRNKSCAFALIAEKDTAQFRADYRGNPKQIAQFSGFNLGRGNAIKLTLYSTPQH